MLTADFPTCGKRPVPALGSLPPLARRRWPSSFHALRDFAPFGTWRRLELRALWNLAPFGTSRRFCTTRYGKNLYPVFQTVVMCLGDAGFGSSFRLSSAMCVSIVRLTTDAWYPHTVLSSSAREIT